MLRLGTAFLIRPGFLRILVPGRSRRDRSLLPTQKREAQKYRGDSSGRFPREKKCAHFAYVTGLNIVLSNLLTSLRTAATPLILHTLPFKVIRIHRVTTRWFAPCGLATRGNTGASGTPSILAVLPSTSGSRVSCLVSCRISGTQTSMGVASRLAMA
jgi:hypothetical protein